jgi:hypothetical protein
LTFPVSGKLFLLSVRQLWAEHNQSYAIFSGDGARRLILNNGRTQVQTKAVTERASAPNIQFCCGFNFIQSLGCWFITKPSFSGVVWPVLSRHQSTPKPRASATISCFLRPPGVCGSMIRKRHFLHSR